MNKNSLLFFIMMLLAAGSVKGQITLNLALNSRPQPWLSEWGNSVNGIMVISYFQGTVQVDPNIKIRTTLINAGGTVIGTSNFNTAAIYVLKQGLNQFSMADALQLQNLILQGSVKNLLQRTGRLLAGQYQLMIEITNRTGTVVQAQQTHPFFITSYQLPVLMQPANGSELDAHIAESVILFRWTSLVPSTQDIPVYRVQVFEILPGQTPMQAFRGNHPLLDAEAVKGTTQYIWRPDLPMLDSTANRRFIWTLQTFDANGQPVQSADNNNEGRSEPAIFTIVNQMGLKGNNMK